MRRSLLVVFAAAVASGFVITSALADASFTDPAGDALGNAPDITAVQVSSDSGGQILFSVTVSNLTPESAVWLRLDTDKDATTGSGGAEYVLLWRSSATADKNGWWFGKWDGSQLNLADHPTVQVSLAPDGVQFSISKSDLGGTSGFAFIVFSFRYNADVLAGMDFAPNGPPLWTYDLPTATPTPTPAVVKPVFGAAVTVPARPVAGKKLVFTLAVNRSDTGAPLTTGTMTCDPSVSGIMLKHVESFAGGKARLTFVVPKTAKGKLLKVKVKIVNDTQSATKVVPYRVS